jgi:hypothetical protein
MLVRFDEGASRKNKKIMNTMMPPVLTALLLGVEVMKASLTELNGVLVPLDDPLTLLLAFSHGLSMNLFVGSDTDRRRGEELKFI